MTGTTAPQWLLLVGRPQAVGFLPERLLMLLLLLLLMPCDNFGNLIIIGLCRFVDH